MNEPGVDTCVSLAVNVAECGVRPGPKTPKPKPEPKACPYVPGKNSFAADTMVWIKDGLKAIQDIREGDEVLAWDPATNTPTLKPVLGTTSRVTDDIYRLTLVDAGGKRTTTIVTGNHPYLLAASAANDNDPLRLAANDNGAVDPSILRIVPGGDWKIVRFLKPGDQIRTALNGRVARDANGELSLIEGPAPDAGGHPEAQAKRNDLLTVVSVELDRSPRQVYNFEVADLHSYAVGPLGEWVHNAPWKYDLYGRISTGQMRKAWENFTGKKWPSGCVVQHDLPLADGGTNHPSNLRPMTRSDHVRHHTENGDFARWGRRGRK